MALPALVLVLHLVTEKVDRSELPDDLSWTWILTIDTCHDLMVSEPKRLAEILVERCRLYSR
jgi:hypothetical protein